MSDWYGNMVVSGVSSVWVGTRVTSACVRGVFWVCVGGVFLPINEIIDLDEIYVDWKKYVFFYSSFVLF